MSRSNPISCKSKYIPITPQEQREHFSQPCGRHLAVYLTNYASLANSISNKGPMWMEQVSEWLGIVNYWLARLTCSVCLCALLIWSQGNDKACRISTTTHVDGVMICKSAPLFYFALFLCSVSFFQYIAKPGYVRDLGILNLFSRELFGFLIYWFSTCIMNIPPQNTVSKEIIKKNLEVRWI